MESLVYHLHRSEITSAFLDELRSAVNTNIGGERIKIIVEQEMAEITNPILLQKIEENLRATHEYALDGNELHRLIERAEQDETFDAVAAITAHKRPRIA
jgi:hypothetical protein